MTANNSNNHDRFIQLACEAIEKKLGWGTSEDWTSEDFNHLSDQIFEVTDLRLSSTTLKRIWGRVKYSATPHTTTLNAIALFLGYKNWRAFRQDYLVDLRDNFAESIPKNPSRLFFSFKTIRFKIISSIVGVSILAISWILWANTQADRATWISPEALAEVQFNSQIISRGLPNTVVFDYDFGSIEGEVFQIQQSWDRSKRVIVEQKKGAVSTIYYYPGYYRAKLVVDDQIIKEHDLYITSDGWMGAIDKEPMPRYLLPEELILDDHLRISDVVGASITQTKPEWLSFAYLKDFENLHSQGFTLETTFRHSLQTGDNICQQTRVQVIGTNGLLSLPFVIPGCTGKVRLFLNGQSVRGESNDLSAFGCDFSNMQDLKLTVEAGEMTVWLNRTIIFKTLLEQPDFGDIVGVRYRFLGNGEVGHVRLSNHEGVVILEEGFEPAGN